MPTTGEQSQTNEMYKSSCRCETLFTATPGFYFPSCFSCGKAVRWIAVTEPMAHTRSTVSEMKRRA